jgi:hypothetical protein
MIAYSFIFAGMLLALSVPRLVGFLSERDDIWWTPKAMAVPLGESRDRVEIYVGGTPLPRLLDTGQILVNTGAGSRALTSGEIGLRFNNWDRVRARRTPLLLGYAASAGAGALFLGFGLIGLYDRARGKA